MNFSKLLCLVLVCSEPFGQVLADTAPECEVKTPGTAVQCKGKKGGVLKLKVTGTVPSGEPDVTWHKDGGPSLTSDDTEYKITGTKKTELKILNLAEDDEGEYEAKGVSPAEKFKVQVVPVCVAAQSAKVTCNGKLDGELELKMDGATTAFKWYKDDTEITADGTKYGPVNEITLTIKKLDDNDEKVFKGSANGQTYEFAVQGLDSPGKPQKSKSEKQEVVNCLGATGTVQCKGELSKALKLGISDAVGDSKVVWTKEEGVVPASSQKLGTKDEGLKFPSLAPADVGTYKATYNTDTVVSFTVSVPDLSGNSESDTKKESTENGKDNSGGGGSSNSGTDQVNLGEGKGKGAGDHGGGGGGLSYSPALLVTVTLVHLLLQLAA